MNIDHITDEEIAFIAREHVRLQNQLKRAEMAGAPATLTFREWITIVERFSGLCAICKSTPFEAMEHLMPVQLGGGTTADNVAPVCGTCNSRKGARMAIIDAQLTYIISPIPGKYAQVPADDREWITPKEFAEAVNQTITKIYEWMGRGIIEAHRPGGIGRYRIHKDELNKYLCGERSKSA